MYHMCTHRRDAHWNSGIPVFWSHIVTLLSSGLWTHKHKCLKQWVKITLSPTDQISITAVLIPAAKWRVNTAITFFPTWRVSKLPPPSRWRGCQRHLQQSFTCEASVSRLSYFVTISNYKGMSVHKLAHTVWRSINVCGKHTFTSVFMGVIKALQRCKTCHPADLQQKILRTSHSYLSASSCHASKRFPLPGPALFLIFYAKEPMMDKNVIWLMAWSKTDYKVHLNMHIKALS